MRDLIRSEWYQRQYGHKFEIRRDKDGVNEFHNNKTGFRVSVGVGGGTGHRVHRIVTDDPHKINEIESATKRSTVLKWWRDTMGQRGTSPKKSTHVIVMQRLHVNDLAGDAMNNLGYESLIIPNEYEPSSACSTSIGWKDPRTKHGELAWPARFDKEATEELKRNLGSRGYASQCQQQPYPAGGNMIKRDWFKVVKQLPANFDAVRGWDHAGTDEAPGIEPAYTAGVKIVKDRETGRFCIADCKRFRATAGVVEKTTANVASQDGKLCRIVIEQEPGSSGKSVIHTYVTRVLVGYPARGVPATGSKPTRLRPFAAQAEAGNVDILQGDWNDDWLTEMEQAPNGQFMDQADATAHAFNELADRRESTAELMARIRG